MNNTVLFVGKRLLAGVAMLISASSIASAHITFENREAKPGTTVKFVLRIPHGCAGAATTGIRIAIPKEFSDARPQPKPGWTLDVVTDSRQNVSVEQTHAHAHGHGGTIKEISWSGGRLEDAHYDEFVFRAAVAKTATGTIFVPVIQQCGDKAERWIEIPGAGGVSDDLKYPAPSVRVQP